MHLRRKIICVLLGALMLLSALPGCARREEQDDAERFTVRAALCDAVDSLDPAMNTDEDAESVFRALYENLLRLTPDENGTAELSPGVAREYTESVNYDGTVDYVFTLRSAARWSDGTRVKAKDFVFAWRRLVAEETVSPNRELLSMVKGYDEARATGDTTRLAVAAEGDNTFRVTLSAPCPYFLSEVCTAVATMPLRSDAIGRDPDWATGNSVPYNGPYQLSLWVKGSYLQMRRSDSYYESRLVGPDVLRFQFVSNADEAWQLYENGGADYVRNPPEGTQTTGSIPLRSTACVFYNHVSDVFSNIHVRRAFDLSLDRAAIAAAAGAGMTPATGLVPSGVVNAAPGEEEDFRTAGGELCRADKEGYAMRCLEAEGELRNGGYWGAVGFPTVGCLYVSGDEARIVAAAVAANWQEKLGVAVTTEGVTREEFDRRLLDGEYDVAIDVDGVAGGDAMEYLKRFAGTDGNNALHYASTPYDLLIGVSGTSADAQARAAFLHDAEALLLEDTALSPLYFRGATYLLADGLSGVYHDQRGSAYFTAVTRTETAESEEKTGK